MPDYPISLGSEVSGYGNMTSPSPMHDMGRPNETEYPDLELKWDGEYDLPESGEMTVKFVKTKETTQTEDGKTRQCVCLDIISIESVKADKSVKEVSPGDILDKLKGEAEDAAEESDENYVEE